MVGCTLACLRDMVADPTHFFPIGMYGVQSAKDLETIHSMGFNCAVGSSDLEVLHRARALEMKVISSPGNPHVSPEAREAFLMKDAHPSLLSWYLMDEPDMHRVPPWKVAMNQRQLKLLHPLKPTSIVLFDGEHAADYGMIPDILMIDHYPIPWVPLSHFSQHVQSARHAFSAEKPLYAVLQAFDWEYFKELVPGVKHFRPPTFEELNCMTYAALAQGVDGLFFYTLRARDWDLIEHPDVRSGLEQVIRSVKEVSFLLGAKREWWIPSYEIEPYLLRRNASLHPSISMTRFRDEAGHVHLLLINTTANPLELDLTLPDANGIWSSVFNKDTPFGGFRPGESYLFPFQGYQVRLLKGTSAPKLE